MRATAAETFPFWRVLSVLRMIPVALAALSFARSLAAQPPPPKPAKPASEAAEGSREQRAAAEFDAGVRFFENAQYEAAARAFLRADVIAPNSEAVANAIAAARRANDHLLVARAAERGIERDSEDPGLAAKARRALADSSRHLARLELDCEPKPCELSLDGSPIEPGGQFVLPGTHSMIATTEQGRAQETQSLIAGTTYRVVLHPAATNQPQQSADIQQKRHAAPVTDQSKTDAAADQEDDVGGLAPAVFYVAAGVTGALVAATTWSGIDTLSARSDLPDAPTREENDDVRTRIRRTDILLVSSVVATAATTYVGIALVDWDGGSAEAVVVPTAEGGVVLTRARF